MRHATRPYRLLCSLAGVALVALGACGSARPAAGPSGSAPTAPGQPSASQSAASTPLDKLAAINRLPPEERHARLVEEARQEGTVVWYSTVVSVESDPFIASFNERYPDVKVQYVRANADELLDKLTSEYRAGKHLADVIMTGQETYPDLKRANVMGRYCSPERQAIGDGFKDRDCEWTVRYYNPKVIGYNTSKLTADQAPRTWNDLLDPRWKGRLGMPADDGPEWVVMMEYMLGKDQGAAYLRRMADQQVQLHRGNTALAQLIAAGDVDAGFYINIPAITNTQKKGAPIASHPPEPLPATMNSVMIAREVQHPFAAALLIDYQLSREGQLKMAEISTRFGPRTDLQYPEQSYVEGVKLFLMTPEMSESDTYRQSGRQFKELFGQR